MTYTHPTLFAPPAPIPITDPHVAAVDRPRLSHQCLLVLERLRRGVATNRELAGICLRTGARLYDLRKAGYSITTSQMKDGSGVVFYRLTSEPQGSAM